MQLWQNVPFFCIMLSMLCGVTAAMLPQKAARLMTVALTCVTLALNAWLLARVAETGESFVYRMGHFPAPWGNELRAGVLEALLATAFSAVLLPSVLGGMTKVRQQIDPHKQNLFYVMLDLMLAALLALIYTNDLFTAYVFIEIMTISACALIMARQNGRTMVSAMRYMIMSLLASGLLLIAISILYTLTGHLLMEDIRAEVAKLAASGAYAEPLTVVIALFFVGLAIKSALFPFHTWLPDAYGYATPTASAVLSSLVSKGYIVLLVKFCYRVIGMDVLLHERATQMMFVFGVTAMMLGSLSAIRAHDLRRMIAFSSVSQIGYIYAGFGLGTEAGFTAALYHLLMHSVCKSALFIAASGLSDASGDSKRFADLRGAGYRYPAAGVAFTVCALSMVGVPVLGGFVSKLRFATAAFSLGGARMWVLIAALALSTLLNAVYFMHTVLSLYRAPREGFVAQPFKRSRLASASMWAFAAMNMLIGFLSYPILNLIVRGLQMLG